jgi:hypothetical protein
VVAQPKPATVGRKQVAGAQACQVAAGLTPKINAAHRSTFGRNPTPPEHTYWLGRVQRCEKRTFEALLGAMRWQQLHGRPAAAAAAGAAPGNLVSRVNALHRQAFGRNPTGSEHAYWLNRVLRGEKTSESALLGAMRWHVLAGIGH